MFLSVRYHLSKYKFHQVPIRVRINIIWYARLTTNSIVVISFTNEY